MRLLFVLSVIICLVSCGKNIEDVNQKSTDNFFLNFEIQAYENWVELNDQKFSVESSQDLSYGVHISKHDYYNNGIYISERNNSPDSLFVNTAIRFNITKAELDSFKVYEIQFVYKEAKENLIEESDSTYSYISNKALYHKLGQYLWSENVFEDLNQMIFRIPNETSEFSLDMPLTSSGFNLEHEQFELTKIIYNEDSDQIEVEGTFDITVKLLSCGYVLFYEVKNANFLALIE